jgi:NitT/TauT family transport system substrate-binding protein
VLNRRERKLGRRKFLREITLAGAAPLVGMFPMPVAGEPPPETTRLRVLVSTVLCEAPVHAADDLLRGEGFSDLQYVQHALGRGPYQRLASGEVDLATVTSMGGVLRVEAGDPVVMLAGYHAGCFELFGNDRVHAIRDLKGKVAVVQQIGTTPHALIASMASYVGLDPQKDITWAIKSGREAIQFFIDGHADAFMGFPPEPQELRARKIGHVVVSTTTDRPWSQYFCCMIASNREFVRKHPAATKRAIRAILKSADMCARDPKQTARLQVDRGYTKSYDQALQVARETPYGKWRQHDAEDTVRFFALRLREAGFIKSNPQQIIAKGTDLRFIKELMRELKA